MDTTVQLESPSIHVSTITFMELLRAFTFIFTNISS